MKRLVLALLFCLIAVGGTCLSPPAHAQGVNRVCVESVGSNGSNNCVDVSPANPFPVVTASGGGTQTAVLAAGSAAIGKAGPGYTSLQAPITASSGNVANASAVATLAAAAAKSTWLTAFQITSGGATTGACVSPTVTGIVGGTMTYTYCAPTGALLSATPLVVSFPEPVMSSAVNTAIVVTLPALGAGNTNATVSAQGYQE